MCHPAPLKKLMLEALRSTASERHSDVLERWLEEHRLDEPVTTLARMVAAARAGQPSFNQPGNSETWPLEDALLLAMGLAATSPEQLAGTLRPWLPRPAAITAEYLLLEISSRMIRSRQRILRGRKTLDNIRSVSHAASYQPSDDSDGAQLSRRVTS
jgi:hypothetical protein